MELKSTLGPTEPIYVDSIRASVSHRADEGDPDANYQMAMFHYKGRPSEYGYIACDEAEAQRYWARAAAAGHVQSQLILAYYGAEHWLCQAATKGHRGAQRELGHLLLDRAIEEHMARKPEGIRSYDWRKTPGDPSLFAEPFSWIRRAATGGCPHSAAELAACYALGIGVPANDKEDREWSRTAIRNAAGSGDLLNLANRHMFGVGEPQNAADALRWYIAAALQGNYEAMHTLGHLYARGLGVTRDFREAVNWFEQAEERRLQDWDFGREYRTFDTDIFCGRYLGAVCAFLCSEAAEGSRAAGEIIELVYEHIDIEALNNDSRTESQLRRLSSIHDRFHHDYQSFGWKENLEKVQSMAREGIRSAHFILGRSLFRSREKDDADKGIFHLKTAAEQGVTLAMHLLGDLGHYPDDKAGGVRPNDDAGDAVVWYQRAAKLGDVEAKFKLAFLAEKALAESWQTALSRASSAGFEKPKEYTDVVTAYRELAELGHVRAQARLAGLLSGSSQGLENGRYHLEGDMEAQEEAKYWLRLAAENGYATAAEALAELLRQPGRFSGRFGNREAIKWYIMAARAGSWSACNALITMYNYGLGVAQDATEAMFWRRRLNVLNRF